MASRLKPNTISTYMRFRHPGTTYQWFGSLITCFGVDEQWYYDWDRVAAVLDVRWWIEDGDLFLDYGNGYPLLILADVYVEGRYLTGRLYSNNIDQGTVTLEMSN